MKNLESSSSSKSFFRPFGDENEEEEDKMPQTQAGQVAAIGHTAVDFGAGH
jgi:hypothetical protein